MSNEDGNAVEKKKSEYADQVEKERLAKEALEPKELKALLEKIDWSQDKDPIMVMPSTQVIIISYDPLVRNMSVRHVQNVSGLTDTINILRDGAYQLEQMELFRKIVSNVANIVQNEAAKLFANLKGNIRQ